MYNLVLGQGERGDEWEFERIGTEREKMQVEKELQDLRERLSNVEAWKERRQVIDDELAAVWTDRGEVLEAPAYAVDDSISEPVEVEAEVEQVGE